MTPADPPSAQTVPELLRGCADSAPEAEALVVGTVRFTYAQLAARVGHVARALSGLGVGPGDAVAVLVPNVSDWVPATFGVLQCGARVDAFNTWVKAYDLDYLLASSGASVLIMVDRVRSSDLLGELQSLLPELATSQPGEWRSERFPNLRHVVVLGDSPPSGALSWSHLIDATDDDSDGVPDEDVSTDLGDAPAFVLYTSGSTSRPKAVPLCHRDMIVNGFHIGERMGLTDSDRVWFGSPLFWSYGCANALMATFTHRACFVLQEQFEAAAAAALMADEQITAAYLLPPMVDALAAEVPERLQALESLRTGLMIGRPEEIERAAVTLGIAEICNIYGSTETYGNCCVTDHSWPLEVRRVTQGQPLPGVEVRVVDQESGALLPAGTPGEMQVRGRITPGYLNNAEATEAAFTADGWFRTGDRMIVNDDGSVAFVGRTTDMIKTSGINVSPAEVESFLNGHPDIAEVVVLGAPHPTRDQVVVAFVVSRSPDLTPQDVIDYSKARIAGYMVPWAVSIVSELPRTGTGKIVRRTLQDEAAGLVGEQGRR